MSLTSVDLAESASEGSSRGTMSAGALTELRKLAWPLNSLGDGLRAICAHAGLPMLETEPLVIPEDIARVGGENLVRWVSWAAERLGIEAEAVQTAVPGLDSFLLGSAPAILGFYDSEGPHYLLLVGSRFGAPRLLGPDLRIHSASIDLLLRLLAPPATAPVIRDVEQIVDMAGVPASRRERVVAQMLRDRLRAAPVTGLLILRLPASARFSVQVRKAGIWPRIAGLVSISALIYGLEIIAWAVIGEAALNGHLDMGWMSAFVMIVLSAVPLRLLTARLSSSAALALSQVLKSRLLAGGMQAEADAIRKEGVGHLLASIMDAQAFEALAINGGLGAVVSFVELACAMWLVSIGSAGGQQVLLLLAWTLFSVFLGAHHLRILTRWTHGRSRMTHALVERMIGHRTVLAQDRADHRVRREDNALRDYLTESRNLDHSALPLLIFIPSGWMLIGLLGLVPGFVSGTVNSADLAIAVGGLMFSGRALGGIASGMVSAANAVVSWKQIAPLFAAGRRRAENVPFIALDTGKVGTTPVGERPLVIDADSLNFSYPGRARPVLSQTSLEIRPGERVLLQGASGGGKSTFADILTGLRRPGSGLLLLNGLDRQTLGSAWHDFVTKAPQFHENHILAGSLAFNLLMGRNWPASRHELAMAREICDELGLSELIERMPAGMHQIIGETGWQLSHGERSRIFLARALLQDASLTILDESFAALDPQTLQRCMDCAFKRSRTLVVVAHP